MSALEFLHHEKAYCLIEMSLCNAHEWIHHSISKSFKWHCFFYSYAFYVLDIWMDDAFFPHYRYPRSVTAAAAVTLFKAMTLTSLQTKKSFLACDTVSNMLFAKQMQIYTTHIGSITKIVFSSDSCYRLFNQIIKMNEKKWRLRERETVEGVIIINRYKYLNDALWPLQCMSIHFWTFVLLFFSLEMVNQFVCSSIKCSCGCSITRSFLKFSHWLWKTKN